MINDNNENTNDNLEQELERDLDNKVTDVSANDSIKDEVIESDTIEINGHVEGKITADSVIIGKSAVIKGDIFFKNTLKTEEGADIDGYIKRANNGKSNTEEDIAIEEIVERSQPRKSKPIPVIVQKDAV